VEATTGWRFVVEELQRAGFEAHLAEPADTAAARGKKRRAKTDRADAKHLRVLLEQERLPESWIAPAHILDLRETTWLRHTLVEQRGQWQQRIHAILYHHGIGQAGQQADYGRDPRLVERGRPASGVAARGRGRDRTALSARRCVTLAMVSPRCRASRGCWC
jgi:transposase